MGSRLAAGVVAIALALAAWAAPAWGGKQGSPAINNAIPASAEPKDQRGRSRGANPDSGAFER
jgi:hypothetical protein